MSKLRCNCGHIIFDQTDFISYKAHLIADQDYYDLFDEIDKKRTDNAASIAGKYFREIFQCSNCNNIIIFSNNNRYDFVPVKEKSAGILESYMGDKWAGIMSANYHNNKGEIFWQTNQTSEFLQDLNEQDLKELYYKKFDELKNKCLLRHSFLRINGKIEHQFDTEEKNVT